MSGQEATAQAAVGWTRHLRPTLANRVLWLLCLLGAILALRLRPDRPFEATAPSALAA